MLLVLVRPSSIAATTHLHLLSPVMAGSVALLEDVRGVVIHMKETCLLDAKTIAYLSGIPIRTVYHILAAWKKTGEVKNTAEGKQGRPRVLDFGDTQVSKIYLCMLRFSPLFPASFIKKCLWSIRVLRFIP